ncbi:MAG TPA: HNH endonuclease signature motif containing protein [Acidobacteriota bacterium]|nr:HNH endonuclease signature motif containing protein [Acidobacteriota bacterium]
MKSFHGVILLLTFSLFMALAARPAVSGNGSKVKVKDQCLTCPRDSKGHILRGRAARKAFKQSHPCPATGSIKGPCKGYVLDHVVPLSRGGRDDLSNMQWQTKAAAKAIEKWQRRR